MAKNLSHYTENRDNNFNLIRFIAASLVLFSHSFALVFGAGEAEPMHSTLGITWGSIAVDIFFVTSGFLIAGSYFSRNNLIAFVWARVLRIYPALFVAILFCVFGIGISFTQLSLQEYLSDSQTYKYLVKGMLLFFGVEHTLPGVFLDLPYTAAVNGSLWTLPYEVKMYAILALILTLIAYLNRSVSFFSIRYTLLFIGVLSLISHIANQFYPFLSDKFVRLFSMFFIGSAFYVWQEKIKLSHTIILIGLPVLLLSATNKDLFFITYCLLLPFLIFYLAYVPSGFIRKFNSCGDYSYGIYIYAFPIQQASIALLPDISVSGMIFLSFAVTLILAILSWHLIEKKFIAMKGKYVLIESALQNRGLSKYIARIKSS